MFKLSIAQHGGDDACRISWPIKHAMGMKGDDRHEFVPGLTYLAFFFLEETSAVVNFTVV